MGNLSNYRRTLTETIIWKIRQKKLKKGKLSPKLFKRRVVRCRRKQPVQKRGYPNGSPAVQFFIESLPDANQEQQILQLRPVFLYAVKPKLKRTIQTIAVDSERKFVSFFLYRIHKKNDKLVEKKVLHQI